MRLARDPDWRSAMGQRVAKGKHRLFRDRQAIVALEEFVDRVSRVALEVRFARSGVRSTGEPAC